MAEIIPIPAIPDIAKYFINTPQLHKSAYVTLSEKQEKEWKCACHDERQSIIRAAAIYHDNQDNGAFLLVNQKGLFLGFGYVDGGKWHYKILNDKEVSELTFFLKHTGTIESNEKPGQDPKSVISYILDEIEHKGAVVYFMMFGKEA